MSDDLKKKFLGWVQDVIGVKKPEPTRHNTEPLNRSSTTHPFSGDTFQRGGAPRAPRARPQVSATAPLTSGEEPVVESKKRMAVIMDYLKNPNGNPAFKDRALIFRVLTEERGYQQARVVELEMELRILFSNTEPDSEEAARLRKAIDEGQVRQAQIYAIMKSLTGVRGKTGGTSFLTPPENM